MSNITLALHTAQSGLLVNQQALDVIANNIANVNTANYSRKVVNLEQRVVNGTPAGVQIAEITRKTDEGLMESLRRETGLLNAVDSQEDYFERLQELFGAPADNTSLSHLIGNFTTAMEALAATPGNVLEQSDVVRQANDVALSMQKISTTIQDLRAQADDEIADAASEINTLIGRIVTLNDEIVRNAAVSHDVSDLQDKLDESLDGLSELLDISYFYRNTGDVAVFTSSGRALVDNLSVSVTHTPAGTVSATTTHAEDEIGGIFVGPKVAFNDITNDIASGSLKGLIDLRDQVLPGLQSQIDELAATLRDQVNLIHNRGMAFPGAQTLTGTRKLLNSSASTIGYTGNADTRVVLFDSDGNQVASTTIRTIVGGATTTVDNVAQRLENWLQANGASGASVDTSTGVLTIGLNTSSLNVAFRDETSSTAGSTHQDASIQYDINGDTIIDTTVSGFSNFFGLNDFFTDGLTDNIWETDILPSSYTFTGTAEYEFRQDVQVDTVTFTGTVEAGDVYTVKLNGTTFTYTTTGAEADMDDVRDDFISQINAHSTLGDKLTATAGTGLGELIITSDIGGTPFTNIVGATNGGGTVDNAVSRSTESEALTRKLGVTGGDSPEDVVDAINNDPVLGVAFQAALIPDGSGHRIRISHNDGLAFTVYKTGGNGNPLTGANLHVSNARTSTVLAIRSDIVSTPSRISRGSAQWDADRGTAGEYVAGNGDNSIAEAMSEMLTSNVSFTDAGGIGAVSMTIEQYAAAIISKNSTDAATNQSTADYRGRLVESLEFKSDAFRGVNLDEEMAQLILFEQAFGACARVITTIKSMFEALDSAVA